MGNRKISLITLHFINNYGSVLQSIASQLFLEKFGYTVEIVDYVRENCRLNELRKSMRQYYHGLGGVFSFPGVDCLLTLRWEVLFKKRNKVFEEFRRKHLNLSMQYHSTADLFRHPPIADYYCVGSDQVWNCEYNGGVLPEYYLQYAPKEKIKFSLSSSIGIERIEQCNNKELMIKYLEDFKFITVREESALNLITDLGINNVNCILDPTLLIDASEWERLASKSENKYGDYVLVYQLNPCIEMDELAKDIAHKNNLKLIIISNNIRIHLPNATKIDNPEVEMFLSLIKNASYVVTDSFHGTALSIVFERQFFSWLPAKYNTRLKSILSLLELNDRWFDKLDNHWESCKNIDYCSVREKLANERIRAVNIVKKGLKDNE